MRKDTNTYSIKYIKKKLFYLGIELSDESINRIVDVANDYMIGRLKMNSILDNAKYLNKNIKEEIELLNYIIDSIIYEAND